MKALEICVEETLPTSHPIGQRAADCGLTDAKHVMPSTMSAIILRLRRNSRRSATALPTYGGDGVRSLVIYNSADLQATLNYRGALELGTIGGTSNESH